MAPVIFDISVPVYTGMVFFPGDPGAVIAPNRSLAGGDVANISELRLGSHTGTHVDAPHHFLQDGQTVDRLDLSTLIGPARVLDCTHAEKQISRADIEQGCAGEVPRLLMKTRNSSLWSQPDFERDYVSLSDGAADYLVETGIKLAGIDYLSIERFKSETYHVHHALLGAGVVLLEGVDLSGVPAGDYQLICLPLKIRGGDGAPSRAVLVQDGQNL